MGLYAVKPRFQAALGGVEAWLVERRVHPDVLTGLAVAVSLAGGAAFVAGNLDPRWLLAVPPLAFARIALNVLDGLVARRRGLARPWGEVLNEFADRVADLAWLTGAALAAGSDVRIGIVAIVLTLLVSFAGTLAKVAGGRRQHGGLMGKADRMALIAVAAIAAAIRPGWPVLTVALTILVAGLVVTLIQRLEAARADLQSDR